MKNDRRNKILSVLKGVKRPGIESVAMFLDECGYFDAKCHGHHFYPKGCPRHCWEVYCIMNLFGRAWFPHDSIVITAIFHDLGKARGCDGPSGHGARSVAALKCCGLELKDAEEYAISCHHKKIDKSRKDRGLKSLLTFADCFSSTVWIVTHPISCLKRILKCRTRG